MGITGEIRGFLQEQGCTIVGFANLCVLPIDVRRGHANGILLGLPYTTVAMAENRSGRPARYYAEYTAMNERLPVLAEQTAQLLASHGYKAEPNTQTTVSKAGDYRTVLPHKTVATLSGVGWIGKCATLVTKEIGAALRLNVVLTDAPVECGTPITESKCPEFCQICAKICPGGAPSGIPWKRGIDRNEFFDVHACFDAAQERARSLLQIEKTVCGLCIANCPFTREGLGY